MFKNKIILYYFLTILLFFVMGMGVIVYFSSNKTISITGEALPEDPGGAIPDFVNPGLKFRFLSDKSREEPEAPAPAPTVVYEELQESFDYQAALAGSLAVIIDTKDHNTSDITIEGIPLSEINLDICRVAGSVLARRGYYVCLPDSVRDSLKDINRLQNGIYLSVNIVDSDKSVVAAVFNRDFVIPGFGSRELAKAVSEGMSRRTGLEGELFTSPPETDILTELEIPSASIEFRLSMGDAITTTLSTKEGREIFGQALAECIEEIYDDR